MPSTYSDLKVELIATGEQSGTWGTTTNTNLGTALGEAIAASADVAFSSGNVTVTLTDTNATQTARHFRLNCTGTTGGSTRELILGSGCQIEKPYLINNGCADSITVKNTTGTGITVPAGKTMLVYNNGTNVVDAVTHLSSLTLTTDLAVADGGTGLSSGTSGGVLAFTAAGTLASSGALAANALVIGGGPGAAPSTTTTGTGVVTALGVNTGSAGAFVVNGGALGTPSSGTVTNLTGTASININGTVGATTPTTGAFTTATLSSNLTLNGGTANGVLYLNGSKVATSGSTLTFDGTTLTAPTINAASLVVSRSTGWNQSADTYTTTVSGVTDVHTSMRRCLLRDDGSVNYYLDASNSTLKADGSAATLTGADGMVMVEIPAFYVKFTSGATRTWSISLLPSPGYTLHPAFMKDGEFVPYRYYGAYDACVNSTGTTYESGLNYDNNWGSGQQWSLDASPKLASVSGVYPAVGITRANARTLAANRGTGWRLVDAYLAWAVELLFLIEFGTFRTQQTIGNGNVAVSTGYPASSGNQTDSPHSVAGKSNSIGNASTNTTNGASSGTRDTAFMSYRGIENWYGNCWNWIDGYNINNNQAYVSNTRANFADDTATNYNAIGAAMVASDGWITNCRNEPFAFLPSAVGGSSSTYWADYYYQAAGWRVACFGGLADLGAFAGGFCWNLDNDSSYLSRAFGARLAF